MNEFVYYLLLIVSFLCVIALGMYNTHEKKRKILESVTFSLENCTPLNEFLYFLYENDLFVSFFNNFGEKYKELTAYTNTVKKQNYIAVAFKWVSSEEGFHFWNEANIKWNDYISKKDKCLDVMELIEYIKNLKF